MNKQMIDDVCNLVNITMSDLILVTRNYNTGTVDIYLGFLKKSVTVKLSVADIVRLKNSAKGFFEYQREKITEEIKEKSNE